MQTTWAQQLDPLIASPLTNGQLLTTIALGSGTTVVNHKLGRKLVGWMIVGINGAATVYDKQATNQMPQLTLVQFSSARNAIP